jgi:hypothetical protein
MSDMQARRSDRAAACPQQKSAADLLKIAGGSPDASSHRCGFIEQNHGVGRLQSGQNNRRARDLLLISCRFSDADADNPTEG